MQKVWKSKDLQMKPGVENLAVISASEVFENFCNLWKFGRVPVDISLDEAQKLNHSLGWKGFQLEP